MEHFVSRVDLCVIQISLLTAARKLGVRPELTETHQKRRQPHRVSRRWQLRVEFTVLEWEMLPL